MLGWESPPPEWGGGTGAGAGEVLGFWALSGLLASPSPLRRPGGGVGVGCGFVTATCGASNTCASPPLSGVGLSALALFAVARSGGETTCAGTVFDCPAVLLVLAASPD